MEEKKLIQHIKQAGTKLRNSKLSRLSGAKASLESIVNALGLGAQEEAIAFVAIMDRQCCDASTSFSDLAEYFQCTTLDALELAPHIIELCHKGYVEQENPREQSMLKKSFIVTDDVFTAILEGKTPCATVMKKEAEADQFEFLCTINDVIGNFRAQNITYQTMQRQILSVEKDFRDLDFVKSAIEAVPDLSHRGLFYNVCHEYVGNPHGMKDLSDAISESYEGVAKRTCNRREFIDFTHPLTCAELVECRNSDDLTLLDRAIVMLYGEDASAYIEPSKNLTRYEFITRLYNIVDNEHQPRRGRSMRRTVMKMKDLEDKNPQLGFIDKLRVSVPDEKMRLMLYLITREVVQGQTYTLGGDLEDLFPKSDCMRIAKDLKAGTNLLEQRDLIEFQQGGMFDSANVVLTDHGKEIMFEEDADLFCEAVNSNDLIEASAIVEKRLFFDGKLERQLGMLKQSLEESRYNELRSRLKSKGMPCGIAALLYGAPGTGKTESVMQIARATGRAVMHVDISATKTCWFGESEKLIKEVFSKYKRLCKKSKVTPILLFNEADAVFSKRKDANSSNVAQTENAIQNIILEQMESLDGILIATTNLAENLDSAFERRFLFKVKYDKPSLESKRAIWLDKMPTLSEREATSLAGNYNFSGGEIDNIVRKATMSEVLNGETPAIDAIIGFCEEEKIASKRVQVGF